MAPATAVPAVEAGARVHVRVADLTADFAVIRRIRFAVFVDEQRVPADLEMDDRDGACIHVLAFTGDEAVATGRIDIEHAGKIGRVAVLAEYRGSGIGTTLMAALHLLATERGLAEVWCNAQLSATRFYTRLGYRVASEPFDEAGIQHVRMTRPLAAHPTAAGAANGGV
jgi:predicted GNAT family N-acyltransferase